MDIFSRTAHVETVVLLSHKKADTYINVNVEFGEGEGKIPIAQIAEKAEAYKPSEKVTYKVIKEYIEGKYGVRIEDSVAVTADGCEILTKTPKDLMELL